MLLSKEDFAQSCGVQLSTVYNWISANKAGIKDYMIEGMIESAIFDKEPFKHKQIRQEKKAPEKKTALKQARESEALTALQAEVDQLKNRVQELEMKNGALTATVSAQQSIIESKDAVIQGKDSIIESKQSEIDTLKADVAFLRTQIPPRLPEPRGLFGRIRGAFRKKEE